MATRGLIPITLLLATCTIWAKDFTYTELPTARLPYGETIGVTGKLEDIKSGLSALMEVEALTRISILALARSQDTPPLLIPRLFALNPAHHLRR